MPKRYEAADPHTDDEIRRLWKRAETIQGKVRTIEQTVTGEAPGTEEVPGCVPPLLGAADIVSWWWQPNLSFAIPAERDWEEEPWLGSGHALITFPYIVLRIRVFALRGILHSGHGLWVIHGPGIIINDENIGLALNMPGVYGTGSVEISTPGSKELGVNHGRGLHATQKPPGGITFSFKGLHQGSASGQGGRATIHFLVEFCKIAVSPPQG